MRHKLKSSKYFLIFFTSLFALTILLFSIYSIYSYAEIKNNEIKISEEYLSNFSGKFNSLLAGYDNLSTQIAMLPSVNNLLYDTEAKDLSSFYRLNKDLEAFSSYSTLQSIYIYFLASSTVYNSSGGLDKIEDFNEKSFIRSLDRLENGYGIYPRRNVERAFQLPRTIRIFTFVRQIPLFNSHKGYVLLNVDYDSLAKLIASVLSPELKDICITRDNTVIFSTSPMLEGYLAGSHYTPADTNIKSGSEKYILLHSKLHQYSFELYSVLPLSTVYRNFSDKMMRIANLFAVILLIEVLLSWFLSMLTTEPLNRLIRKIQAHNPRLSGQPTGLTGFDGLNQALDGLFDIVSMFESNVPVLRESILLSMLWENGDAAQATEDKFSQYGIEFNKKFYLVIVACIDEIDRVKSRQIKDQLRLYMKQSVTNRFSCLGNIYGILMESSRVAFILNTDTDIYCNTEDFKVYYDTASQIHTRMIEELGIHVVLSFGTVESNCTDIHKSYLHACNNLLYSSFFNEESIVFCDKSHTAPVLGRLPYAELVTSIINKDDAAISSYIHTLVEKCRIEKLNDTQIKRLLITFVSSIYNDLWEKGINTGTSNLTFALAKITNINDFTRLYQHISDIVNNITALIGQDFDEQQNKKINAAKDYIHKHYSRNISVHEIADYADLNHIYLNRIFKLSTGKTLSEYLNIFRIERSKDYLNQAEYSLNDISKMVGYNDVRSYNRFFKKYFGISPNDARNPKSVVLHKTCLPKTHG